MISHIKSKILRRIFYSVFKNKKLNHPEFKMDSTPNESLAKHLSEIAEYYKIENDPYRYKVFSEAVSKIELYPDEITSGQEAKEIIGRGIGPSIMEVIDEYLATGSSKRLEDLKIKHSERARVVTEFTTVHGIGPVTANKFYDQGFRTVDELWYNAPLTEAQKISIYYRNHLKERIPREEIDWLNRYLKMLFPMLHFEIVGSYRRGEPTSGDIDILIRQDTNTNLENIINTLSEAGVIVGTLALGSSKYLGLLRIGERPVRRLDLLIIVPESWASALLYFTGSQRFNILTRQRAKDLKLKLNEYGLYDYQRTKENRLQVNTEEDIFRLLGVKYLTPQERTRSINTLQLI